MRTRSVCISLWPWLVSALASQASVQLPLAPRLACHSVALTTCRGGFCSTQLVEPGAGETLLAFDLIEKTFTMPSVRPGPTQAIDFTIEPGAPNHRLFEAKFQIELAHGRLAKVDLIEVENGPLKARATTAFTYPDGLTVVTGYACERNG